LSLSSDFISREKEKKKKAKAKCKLQYSTLALSFIASRWKLILNADGTQNSKNYDITSVSCFGDGAEPMGSGFVLVQLMDISC